MPKSLSILKELLDSVMTGNWVDVEKILSENKEIGINDQYSYKHTLLHNAAIYSSLSMVRGLVEKGADPFALTEYDETPGTLAKQVGKKDIAEYLETVCSCLKQYIEAYCNNDLESAKKIFLANPEIIKAHIQSILIDNKTLLENAFEKNNISWVGLLIKHEANPNLPDANRDTLITKAAKSNRVEMVKCLVEAGAYLDQINNEGFTALMIASNKNHPEIVKVLVESNAIFTTNYINAAGDTALTLALKKGFQQVVVNLCKSKAINLKLMHEGVDPPLIIAAKQNNVLIMRSLLDSGKIDINAVDGEKRSAIIHAVKQGSLPAVALLCSSPIIQLENRDQEGETPLTRAVSLGYKEIVIELLKKGASLAPNSRGFTPLMLARHYGYSQIVKTLLEQQFVKETQEIATFIKQFRLIKETGHIMGLDKTFKLKLGHVDFNISSTSYHDLSSIKLLVENIIDYNKFIARSGDEATLGYFKAITEAFSAEIDYLKFEENPLVQASKLCNQYKQNKLIIFPCVWKGHSTTIALYKDCMVVCNRGQGGDRGHGTMIYRVKDRNLITPEFIASLYPSGTRKKQEEIESRYKAVIQTVPIAKLPSKGQKYGTCSFVNAKSMIEGILYIMVKDRFDQNNVPRSAQASETQELTNRLAETYAEKQYKKFTTFIRDRQIDSLIEAINTDPKEKRLYQILLAIIFDKIHCSPKAKIKPFESERLHAQKENKAHKLVPDFIRTKKILSALDKATGKILIDKFAAKENEFLHYIQEVSNHGQIELFKILTQDRDISLLQGKLLMFNPQWMNDENIPSIAPSVEVQSRGTQERKSILSSTVASEQNKIDAAKKSANPNLKKK